MQKRRRTLRGFSLRIDTIVRSYDSMASCSARSCSSTVDDMAEGEEKGEGSERTDVQS